MSAPVMKSPIVMKSRKPCSLAGTKRLGTRLLYGPAWRPTRRYGRTGELQRPPHEVGDPGGVGSAAGDLRSARAEAAGADERRDRPAVELGDGPGAAADRGALPGRRP